MTDPKLGRCSTCDELRELELVPLNKHTSVGLCGLCEEVVTNWQRMEAIEREERSKAYRKATKKK